MKQSDIEPMRPDGFWPAALDAVQIRAANGRHIFTKNIDRAVQAAEIRRWHQDLPTHHDALCAT